MGTAAADGRVNISPKGQDTLRVLDANRVAWLNLTGSGNETAAHLLAVNRITLMWCAFEGKPNILRLYGTATVYHPRDAEWAELLPLFPPLPGARQIVVVEVELVQTSCGMAVPFFDYRAERNGLHETARPRAGGAVLAHPQPRRQAEDLRQQELITLVLKTKAAPATTGAAFGIWAQPNLSASAVVKLCIVSLSLPRYVSIHSRFRQLFAH
ncbi:pyridoxamine 5'-phosphate oxidase family protein [Hymenobacter citatus]|uniref:pyridoxamine 5'-phosphate oxidase family protein n=1 Tax=Hymenobacter citatus TaxID=2763506 RepID=UPI0031B59B87